MKNQVSKEKNLRISNVYLSDMASVMAIYRAHHKAIANTASGSTESNILTEQFGIPLSIASDQGAALGYAYVYVNESGKLKIGSCFKEGFNSSLIVQSLEAQAQITFTNTFETSRTDEKAIRHSILKLVDWLNHTV